MIGTAKRRSVRRDENGKLLEFMAENIEDSLIFGKCQYLRNTLQESVRCCDVSKASPAIVALFVVEMMAAYMLKTLRYRHRHHGIKAAQSTVARCLVPWYLMIGEHSDSCEQHH